MKILKETTKWEDNIPNHTYILNDAGDLKAYVIAGTNEYIEFKKPLKTFSKSKRTFKELTDGLSGGPF